MSIAVTFSNQSKRENSTKQLTMSVTHNCNYKNGCSMLKPTLLLEINSAAFPDYTAFKIENRYYKVTDIQSVRDNLFEVSGTIDVLATYKSNILATTAYVVFDSTSNSELVDKRLPMKTTKSVQVATTACPFDPLSGGVYILSITGSNSSTGVYLVSEAQMAALIDDISDVWDNLFNYPGAPTKPSVPTYGNDFLENVWKAVQYWADDFAWYVEYIKMFISQSFGSGNIPENIRECRYIPFNVGVSGTPQPIYLGTFLTQQILGKLNTETVHRTVSVSIPWQASDWRRRSPFTDVYIYLPYIGMIKLSSENLVGQSSINVSYTLALRDGSLICTLESGGEVIGQYSGNVGVSVPIGFSNTSIPKASQAIISEAVNAAAGNLAGTGLAAINALDSLTPNFSCIGGLDGLAGIATNQNSTCYTVFHDTVAPPNTELNTIGSPTMRPKSLATLTNFVQTIGASVEGAMTSEERRQLNSLLDSGIYIE